MYMNKVLVAALSLLMSFSTLANELANDDKQTTSEAQEPNEEKGLKKIQARPDFPGTIRLELGSKVWLNAPEEMRLSILGSRTFNVFYQYDIRIKQSRYTFSPGLGFGFENYRTRNNLGYGYDADGLTTLIYYDSANSPLAGVNKTKLSVNYIDIPLEIRFHSNKNDFQRSLKIALGAKVGYMFNAHSKVRYKLDDDTETRKLKRTENFNLSQVRFGPYFRFGYGGISLFGYYGVNGLWQNDKGPNGRNPNPIIFGLSLNLF